MWLGKKREKNSISEVFWIIRWKLLRFIGNILFSPQNRKSDFSLVVQCVYAMVHPANRGSSTTTNQFQIWSWKPLLCTSLHVLLWGLRFSNARTFTKFLLIWVQATTCRKVQLTPTLLNLFPVLCGYIGSHKKKHSSEFFSI